MNNKEKQGLSAVATGGSMTTPVDAKAAIARVQAIQKIMAEVMKPEVHYGKIPGTGDKLTLYKPGSEALLSAFQIAVEPEVKVTRDGDHITYEVIARGIHIPTGACVGAGVGEGSTAEDKYAWRAAVCTEEYDETPENRRRCKWNKGKKGYGDNPDEPAWAVYQVRTNPSDIANTVLKMAKKRAQIDMTLTALAASDIFSQDLEEFDEDGSPKQQTAGPRKPKYAPKPKTGEGGTQAGFPDKPASEAQVKLLKTKLQRSGKQEIDMLHQFKVDAVESLKMAQVNDAIAWIDAK